MNSGIINILKPAGITSNQVLFKLKKMLKPKKIGHLGTLDPSASGVLPVCINKATKLFDYFLKKDKIYKTIFVFGKETDTLDSDGVVTNQNNKIVKKSDIENVLFKLVGKQNQVPPLYSAKKVNGQKAYELARNGENFELKSKEIEIFDIKLISEIKQNTFLFEIHCSSGTYVRSIARDLAKMLGTVAYVGAIIRTKSGMFDIQNAQCIDDISEKSIIDLGDILKENVSIVLDDKFFAKITNGCEIQISHSNQDNCSVFCKNQLIGIGKIKDNKIRIVTSLWEKYD